MAELQLNQVGEISQIWDNALRVRELANARAALRLRVKRLRSSRISKALNALLLIACGVAIGGYYAVVSRPTQVVQQTHYTIAAVPMPEAEPASAPEQLTGLTPSAAVPSSDSEPHSSSMRREVERYKKRAKAANKSQGSDNKKDSDIRRNPSETPVAVAAPPLQIIQNPIPANVAANVVAEPKNTPALRIVNIPIDGILNVEIQGSIRAYKVGERLPDGSLLQSADAKTGKFMTVTGTAR